MGASRRGWLVGVVLLVDAVLGRPVMAAEAATLEVGIFPYLSVRTLLERYQPLRDHLERALGRPVQFVTAPDFRSFVERTQAGQYPLVITAPHFARLAQRKADYRPLLQPVNAMHGVFLVAAPSPVRGLADLKGLSVATPDRLALVTALGEEALSRAGLSSPADVRLDPHPSHNAAIQAVLRGGAGAALVSTYVHLQMSAEIRGQLRVVAETAALPAPLVILAGPVLANEDAEAIRTAVVEFTERTEEGRRFMESTHYRAMEVPAEADLERLDPYLPALERALADKS